MNINHHIYPIKKGDTLKKIAEETGLSIEGIKAYHNRYCELDQLIVGDDLPGLHKLFIPKNIEKVRDNTNTYNLKFNLQEEYYEIETKTSCTNLKKELYNTETHHIWRLGLLNNYTVELIEVTKKVSTDSQHFDNLLKFNSYFDEPTKKLILELDENGEINKIINQKEIYSIWLTMKKEFEDSMKIDETTKQSIINSGDYTFKDTLSSISKNLLYTVFFPKIYGIKENDKILDLGNKNMPSLIFLNNDKEIQIQIKEKCNINDKTINITQKTFLPQKSKDLFAKDYKKDFSPVLGNIFDYNFEYISKYTYTKDCILEKCETSFIEQVNEDMQIKLEYKIKRKKR